LQESAINSGTGVNPTAQAYANILNDIDPAGLYVAATLNATTDGNATGNGPNTLVYRSASVTLLGQTGVGTSSSSGAPRQVARYQFQPIGNSSANFYVYVSHMKSGTGSSNENRRGAEATIINTDVNALPNNTPFVFTGDYNPTSGVTDQGYQGVVGNTGSNHAVDPLNPTNNLTQTWSNITNFETESPLNGTANFTGQSNGGMHFRDDFIMNSPGMLAGNAIHYLTGSYVEFGNTATFDANGNQINPATHTNGGSITSSSNSAFAAELSGTYGTPSGAAGVLTALTQAADHLPVVSDYQFTPVPEPSTFALLAGAAAACAGYFRRSGVTAPY
jgi:hypothetical protein